ncbi:inositol monophosphatase family protein [Rhizobium sp. TRM95796]|uniref:inositol monophosphatase family protein n=1 Tax=Rhizobium sp. TRM95796 TaxID=2979862 RepID=UPI0021E77C80|nr:inositol monophosphatase [Rhizobium sp. TRM95796]MCV3765289.1 inositol monophosphatase [Rhizobium sp. TRM95796]
MSVVDIEALAHLLREAAKAEIMPRFRKLGSGDIRIKTEASDLVTEGDEAAERFIKARLDSVLPGALFVGEESVATEPELLPKLADADLALVIDPIDGTFNFASGIPLFAVMASVVSKGETVAGVIYDPMGDDWILAEKGAGAYQITPEGVRTKLKVREPAPLAEMFGMASTGFVGPEKRAQLLANFAKVRFLMNYRCAGHEYRAFAGGHVHYLMYNKLMPWDHLAGTLISQEAGAYAARLDGSPYLPSHTEGGLVLTTDKDTWDELKREIFDI